MVRIYWGKTLGAPALNKPGVTCAAGKVEVVFSQHPEASELNISIFVSGKTSGASAINNFGIACAAGKVDVMFSQHLDKMSQKMTTIHPKLIYLCENRCHYFAIFQEKHFGQNRVCQSQICLRSFPLPRDAARTQPPLFLLLHPCQTC